MPSGHKIPARLENPFDWAAVEVYERVLAYPLHAAGVRPNMITVVSCIAYGAAIYLLAKGKALCAAALLVIAGYVLDCWDGYHARKFEQTSRFGDKLDHASDIIGVGLILALTARLAWQSRDALPWAPYAFGGVLLVLVVGSSLQLSCQEKYYDADGARDESPALAPLRRACRGSATRGLRITRWMGCGTGMLALAVLLCVMGRSAQR